MSSSSPPRTPVSSTASSFLSFSPEAPATPQESSAVSPSVYSFDDATPRASRTRILSNLNTDVPPVPRLQLPSSARRFGSRNPFAAMLAVEASESASSRSSTSEDDGRSTSRSSTPATSSDDDLVVFEGCFVNPADPFTPAPRSSSLAAAWDACSVVDSLQAMGIDEDGDVSSAWEDELYSSLSESSPLSPSFPIAALQSPFLASGRLPSPRSPQPPKSPRKTRSPHHPAWPRRHPFKRSTTETTIRASPRKSPQRSPRRTPHPPGSPSKTRRASPANLLSPAFAPSSSSSSPDCPAFNFDPTSPVAAPPLRSKRSLAFLSLGSTGKSRREKPPPLPRTSSATAFPPSPRKSPKKKHTIPRRRRERHGDKSSPPRSARTVDGIDLDELDRFFGITPKLAKAMRGGYEDVVMQEGLSEAGRNGMDEAEDFRGLLDATDLSDDGAGATRTRSSPRSSPRRRPPPLDLSNSSPHSRASSWASSHLSADDEAASPLFDDDDASALDACIHLASPVVLAPFSAGRSAALAQARLVAAEDVFGAGVKAEAEERKVLRTKKSVGDRLRDFLGARG
ncbi:Proteophosphoglycan 5 [Rhodotorula toruloides ATCC 204091]|uniref:Proteophosphoglycan 5 n=1 Tax=Rhodotorula toruloides TaxID=5286 RepID=A0A0K3CGN3_RHOTO|nr:Proteophosphoglycan 5 [Rhodotorula toruloides ATCC 204091]KAK4334084.1 Proteophosphoglycan 5 [Rhodotorula toruloides]PRQ72416.1 Proteophosphoglycan 5 [Rhodotorula toruloides]